MMTGRMAKGWGQGGGGVSQGWPGAPMVLQKHTEEAAVGAGLGSMVRTVLKITDWTRRTDHQMPPLNSRPVISFSKHLMNTNL